MRTLRPLLTALLLSLGSVGMVVAADREPVVAPRPQVSIEPVTAPRPVLVVELVTREALAAPRPVILEEVAQREALEAPRPVIAETVAQREALEAPRPTLPVVEVQSEFTATLELPVGLDAPQAREIPATPYSPEPPLPVFNLETHLAPMNSHENTVGSDAELLPAPPAEAEHTRASRPVQTLGGLLSAR